MAGWPMWGGVYARGMFPFDVSAVCCVREFSSPACAVWPVAAFSSTVSRLRGIWDMISETMALTTSLADVVSWPVKP